MKPVVDLQREVARLELHFLRWRVAAVVCFVAAVCMAGLLLLKGCEPRKQSALPIKGMIVCLTLDDVARLKANGGALP